jgi:Ca2+-binding RTX toxin-like protein
MLMSARTVLERLKSSLRSRPAKRKNWSRDHGLEHLEQRALLSSVSVIAGQLTVEANPGEMNRIRIRPLRNGAAYEVTEETREWRNQVAPLVRPGRSAAAPLTTGTLSGVTATSSSGTYGNRVIINDPERTITSVSVSLDDGNDVARIHTARVRPELGKYYLPVTVDAGTGNDAVVTGWGDDYVDGGDGHDYIFTNSGNDHLIGGNGGDKLEGGYHNDTIEENDGSDTMSGGHGEDLMLGGADHDRLHGGRGDDVLDGGTGNDHLSGGWDSDLVIGGEGSDLFMAQWGRHGRSDNDTIIGYTDNNRDGIQDANVGSQDVINVVQGDDNLQGIDYSYRDLRSTHVINTGNMHHWMGLNFVYEKPDWRGLTARQKWDYWVSLRQHWNKEWTPTIRGFYTTTARF